MGDPVVAEAPPLAGLAAERDEDPVTRAVLEHREAAVKILHNQFYPSGTHKTLDTVTRSARHSKFPECNDCQDKRRAYRIAASNTNSTPEQIAAKHQDVVEQSEMWTYVARRPREGVRAAAGRLPQARPACMIRVAALRLRVQAVNRFVKN
eukprot:2876185-Prymnesium_polylepis.2